MSLASFSLINKNRHLRLNSLTENPEILHHEEIFSLKLQKHDNFYNPAGFRRFWHGFHWKPKEILRS
jgi:hypothetical protein